MTVEINYAGSPAIESQGALYELNYADGSGGWVSSPTITTDVAGDLHAPKVIFPDLAYVTSSGGGMDVQASSRIWIRTDAMRWMSAGGTTYYLTDVVGTTVTKRASNRSWEFKAEINDGQAETAGFTVNNSIVTIKDIISFQSNSVEKAVIDKDGDIFGHDLYAVTATNQGVLYLGSDASTYVHRFGNNIRVVMGSAITYDFSSAGSFGLIDTGVINFSSTSLANGTPDAGLERDSAGVVKVTDGSTGVGGLIAGNITAGSTATLGTLRLGSDNTAYFQRSGSTTQYYIASIARMAFTTAGIRLASDDAYAWSSTTDPALSADTTITRKAAGVVGTEALNLQTTPADLAAAPSLSFGDGDTGIYENADDELTFVTGGFKRFLLDENMFSGLTSSSGGIVNESASATNPTLLTRRNVPATGIGSNATDEISLICNSVEMVRVTGTEAVFNADVNCSALPNGTLASPPTGMAIGDMWEDTTDSSDHPIVRIATVTT